MAEHITEARLTTARQRLAKAAYPALKALGLDEDTATAEAESFAWAAQEVLLERLEENA